MLASRRPAQLWDVLAFSPLWRHWLRRHRREYDQRDRARRSDALAGRILAVQQPVKVRFRRFGRPMQGNERQLSTQS